MPFYAHTLKNEPQEKWEPLFTPFESEENPFNPNNPQAACSGKNGTDCPHCESLAPYHGHLNKVAHLASKFAANMFPTGPDRETARNYEQLCDYPKPDLDFAPENFIN